MKTEILTTTTEPNLVLAIIITVALFALISLIIYFGNRVVKKDVDNTFGPGTYDNNKF